MNLFANIFFVFIYLLVMLYFRIPDISENNWIWHKVIIFLALFCYQFLLELINKIKNKCKIEMVDIVSSSLQTSVAGVIGYSIYTDLRIMCSQDDSLMNAMTNINSLVMIEPGTNKEYLLSAGVITLVITFIRLIGLMFGSNTDCIKYK